MSEQPHDKLVREEFRDPDRARGLLRIMLGEKTCSAMKLDTLRVLDGHFIDSELKPHEADLLLAVGEETQATLIYILLDHQSTPDRDMPFRLLRYVSRIHEAHRAGKIATGDPHRRPPVLPLVLYNGKKPWNVPLSLAGCQADAFSDSLPWFPALELRYTLFDLRSIEDTLLMRWRKKVAPSIVLTLLNLKHYSEDNLLERLRAWIDLIQMVEQQKQGLLALERAFCYIFKTSALAYEDIIEALEPKLDRETKEMIKTTADSIYDKGLQEGLEKGIQQGIQEGREEGLAAAREQAARALRFLLRDKFGSQADTAGEDIDRAGLDQILEWTTRILKAKMIEDVFRT